MRKRSRRWLNVGLVVFVALIGAIGAWATGFVPPAWQQALQQPILASAPASIATERPEEAATPARTASLSAANPKADSSQPASNATPKATPSNNSAFGIDVARITANGSSVIAGFAKPSSRITVMADGKPVGTATADQSGDWVLVTPHKFANLDPRLEIKEGDLTAPKVASLANNHAAPKGGSAPKRTAAEVAQQMMRRLEQLTEDASEKALPDDARPVRASQPATQHLLTGTIIARPAAVSRETAGSQISARSPQSPSQAAATRSGPRTSQGEKETRRQSPVGRQTPRAAPSPSRQLAAVARPAPIAQGAGIPARVRTSSKLEKSLPVPVQFIYREAAFTEQGRAAATLLLNYFKAKKFRAISLSGHADERGTAAGNFKLSRERLERIEQFLRDGGYTGKLTLVPKGATEKYTRVDRRQFPIEELYQLDRRVEVIAAH